LIEALTPALIEHVHERDLDVAVVTDGPDGRGLPASLNCTHLLDEHLMVAVGRAHRFARRRAVFLREVIGDTFVKPHVTDLAVLALQTARIRTAGGDLPGPRGR
jgi:DNA-binding transcriptional LysR family regulator